MRRMGQGMAARPGLWAVLALAAYWLVEAGAERIYLGTWDLEPSTWGGNGWRRGWGWTWRRWPWGWG